MAHIGRPSDTINEKFMFDPSQILVTVSEKDINNNNINAHSVYTFTELDGTPHVLPIFDKSKAMCDLCLRLFPSWSKLYTHQGHLCYEDVILEPHPIKLHFDKDQLFYIKDVLNGLNKEIVQNPDGTFHVVHDAAYLQILLRQLYTGQVTKYNIEQWYPALIKIDGVTSNTCFLDLSDEDLKIVQALAKTKLAKNIGMDRRLDNAELEGEVALEEKIAKIMTPGKRYFVRFSTRSPKDGVSSSLTKTPEFQQLPILERLKKKLEILSVTDAKEVLELITRSQRIFSDISFYYQYRVTNASSAKLCLILRDYIPDLPVDHEFRCYAKNRRLTAISQYQCYVKFDALQDVNHVLRCRDAILEFHNKIAEFLPMPDYVIDIVVFPQTYQCQVIELNPFGAAMSSGSALYNWHRDFQLLYGNLNLEKPPIRVLEKLIEEESSQRGI